MKKTPVFQDQMPDPYPSTNKLNRVLPTPFFMHVEGKNGLKWVHDKWEIQVRRQEEGCKWTAVLF